mmetsp:Transcript_51618/g.160147  ORF Transcript_51618/g.160147 Transcript_51618/m.160147 type:complete len:339 (-) Transcript_51618:1556-2572(-)
MSSSGLESTPILRVERCARRLPPQLETACHVCSTSVAIAFAAATRTGSSASSAHFRTPPSPVEMRSSSAARDMERWGARPAGTATETSPAGSHSLVSSLKRAMFDSSPVKATAARSLPVRGSRAAVAAAKEEPPNGSVMLIRWHGQTPSVGKPRHSASNPLLLVRRRPASPQDAPSTSPKPSTPPNTKGNALPRAEPSGWTCTSTPSRARERAATGPAPLEAINDNCCFADHFISMRCMSVCIGTAAGVAGCPRPSASGARTDMRRWASCAIAASFWPSTLMRRRSHPPVWHHSLRVPKRDQGDIHGCMWDGQRITRPSCFRNMRSPLMCSTTRPMAM